jgi:hypothetical protein
VLAHIKLTGRVIAVVDEAPAAVLAVMWWTALAHGI